jgi:hypothetical protein
MKLVTVLLIILGLAGVLVFLIFRFQRTATRAKSVAKRMQQLAAWAVADAEKENGIKLDYSTDSIEKVEEILGDLHQLYLKNPSSISVDGLAMAYGAYIGEAIRRNDPICRNNPDCKWEKDHSVTGENTYPFYWGSGQSFPCVWSYKRITTGPSDNVWHKYLVLRQGYDRL